VTWGYFENNKMQVKTSVVTFFGNFIKMGYFFNPSSGHTGKLLFPEGQIHLKISL